MSDGVENVDDDGVVAHGTHFLQHGKETMPSGPEVRVILKRMHECVRISNSWDVFGARSLDRQVPIHIILMHFWWLQD